MNKPGTVHNDPTTAHSKHYISCTPGMVGLAPSCVRLAPAGAPNALKSDLKKPRICPIWGQSDPLWSQTYHPWQRYGTCG